MTRQEFIKKSAALGIGLPFLSMLMESCDKAADLYPDLEVNFSGKVIIIGAGAAGLTAGYLLNKYNIDFEILEASSVLGGRLKRAEDFADFPIDLGAEWIHEDPSVLAKLISDPHISANVEIMPYSPDTIYSFKNGKRRKHNWGSNFYSEYKFKNTTWYGFFEKYIAPNIADKIIFNCPVNEIDHSADKVSIKNINEDTFEADKVLLTVPITILQNNSIDFIPSLPTEKTKAINSINMPDGIKVFIEFSEKFYPDLLFAESLISGIQSQDKIFYDATLRKDSNRNILGLFSVGAKSSPYTDLETDTEIINMILSELDEMFDGKASQTYVKHIIQNWSKEPYIQGSYGIDFQESESKTAEKLFKPIDNKIYFAGEALAGDNSATVPGAGETAYHTIEILLKN
jgi:monoamine oxidase